MRSHKWAMPHIQSMLKQTVIAVLILIAFGFFLNRIRYGIDFTDEAWYVAEPYIVAKGAIPYINNWSQTPGFTIPLAFLYAVYTVSNGNTEGIFLFSRIMYALFLTAVATGTATILWKKTERAESFIIIIPLLYITPFCLYDINYNTIGVVYLLISAVLLLFNIVERELVQAPTILSGMIIARAVIGTPAVIVAWFIMIIVCVLYGKIRHVVFFLLGNLITTVLVVGWLCSRGGIFDIYKGIRIILTDLAYFNTTENPNAPESARIILIISIVFPILILWMLFYGELALTKCKVNKDDLLRKDRFSINLIYLLGFINFFLIVVFRPYYYSEIESVFDMYIAKHMYPVLCGIEIALALRLLARVRYLEAKVVGIIVLGAILVFNLMLPFFNGDEIDMNSYRFLWFLPIALILSGFYREKDRKHLVGLSIVSVLYFVTYLLMGSINVGGFGERQYYLYIPAVLGLFSLAFIETEYVRIRWGLTIILLCVLGTIWARYNYSNVYRDQPLSELSVTVEKGIWKGLRTTPQRAKNVVEVEEYIREITSKDDDVLFLDQVCFAYLMTDSKACTPNTADAMAYSHRGYLRGSAGIMYKYFETVNKMPNKIVYIDFGRDEMLSIDNEWEFNAFVNRYYTVGGEYDTNPEIKNRSLKSTTESDAFYVRWYERSNN